MWKIICNSLFTLIGSIYFVLYYLFEYNEKLFSFFLRYDEGEKIFSYLNGILGGILVIGVLGFVTYIFKIIMNRYFPKSTWVEFLAKIITFTKYFIALQVFSHFAIVSDGLEIVFNKIYSIGLIVLFLIFITGLIKNYLKRLILSNSKLNTESKTMLLFIEKFVIVLIWIIGGITIFDNLGYNISAFIAGAGIGGLAIAFAAQKSISNIFGAITILLNKPFKYGDVVKLNGVIGKVDGISLTHVKLIENTGFIVYVPNDAIISSNIENHTNRKNRRTEFVLSIDNKTPTTKVQKGIVMIEKILEKYIEDGTIGSYRVTFDNITQVSININVLYFSLITKDVGLYAKQKENINFEIKKALEKLGIKLSNPTGELLSNMGTTKAV